MTLFDEKGATPIEYALIAALLALVIVASLKFLGSNLQNKFEVIAVTVNAGGFASATPFPTRTASPTASASSTPNFLITRTASSIPIFLPTATRTVETPAGGSNEDPTPTCDPSAGRC